MGEPTRKPSAMWKDWYAKYLSEEEAQFLFNVKECLGRTVFHKTRKLFMKNALETAQRLSLTGEGY